MIEDGSALRRACYWRGDPGLGDAAIYLRSHQRSGGIMEQRRDHERGLDGPGVGGSEDQFHHVRRERPPGHRGPGDSVETTCLVRQESSVDERYVPASDTTDRSASEADRASYSAAASEFDPSTARTVVMRLTSGTWGRVLTKNRSLLLWDVQRPQATLGIGSRLCGHPG